MSDNMKAAQPLRKEGTEAVAWRWQMRGDRIWTVGLNEPVPWEGQIAEPLYAHPAGGEDHIGEPTEKVAGGEAPSVGRTEARINELLETTSRNLLRARNSENALRGLLTVYEDLGLNIDHPAAREAYAALKEPWAR